MSAKSKPLVLNPATSRYTLDDLTSIDKDTTQSEFASSSSEIYISNFEVFFGKYQPFKYVMHESQSTNNTAPPRPLIGCAKVEVSHKETR